MKLSEIELDFLYEKPAELFRDKVKQRGEDYEHDNRCACPEAVRRTHLRTLARESIEDVKILMMNYVIMVMKLNKMVLDDKKIDEAARGAADLYEQDLPMMSYDEDTEVDGQHHFCQEFGAELFKDGAEWAEEEFLKNLWHSNTEKPEVGKKILVYTIDGYETITYVGEGEIDSGTNWMDIVSDMAIACWCYPEVLCPKKGGDSK